MSRKYHGTAWPAYLDGITRQRDKLPDLLRAVQHRFESEYLTAQAEGQARRAAPRFALIAAAGELATKLGLTGWPEGAALQAAATCFRAWLARRPSGEGNSEERSMLAQVRMHFEQHGEARCTDWSRPVAEDNHAARTLLRCGFRKHEPSSTEWFVFPESFKSEVCKGFDFRGGEAAAAAGASSRRDREGPPLHREGRPAGRRPAPGISRVGKHPGVRRCLTSIASFPTSHQPRAMPVKILSRPVPARPGNICHKKTR